MPIDGTTRRPLSAGPLGGSARRPVGADIVGPRDDRGGVIMKAMVPDESSAWSLRRATSADVPAVVAAVARLLAELGGPPPFFEAAGAAAACRKIIGTPDLGFVILAEHPCDTIIGVLSVSYCTAIRTSKPYGIIQEAWVDGDARSRSIGRDMMAFARALARTDGIELLEVSIPGAGHDRHREIARFYRTCGFTPAGHRLRRTL